MRYARVLAAVNTLLLVSAQAAAQADPAYADTIALIDRQIRRKWQERGVTPAASANDSVWCKRVFADLVGRAPNEAELQAFLADGAADKRAALVDRLLDAPEFAQDFTRHWTEYWTRLLLGPPSDVESGRAGLEDYLSAAIRENKPYDKLAFDLLTASGAGSRHMEPDTPEFNGAVNFLAGKLDNDRVEATIAVGRIFLGRRLDDLKLDRFWSFNCFLRQVQAERRLTRGSGYVTVVRDADYAGQGSDPTNAEIYFELPNGLLKLAYPIFLDGTAINPSGLIKDVNRRQELAAMILKTDAFREAIVNRLWGRFFRFGLADPIDDMGPHNPASHPELLVELGKRFAAADYDLKRLMRWCAASEAYSLASPKVAGKARAPDYPFRPDTRCFSRFYGHRASQPALASLPPIAVLYPVGNEIDRPCRVAFSPRAPLLAIKSPAKIHFWKIDDLVSKLAIRETDSRIEPFAFSPDGALLATQSKLGLASIWDAERVRVQRRLENPSASDDLRWQEGTLAFCDNGTLALRDEESTKIWDLAKVEIREALVNVSYLVSAPNGQGFAIERPKNGVVKVVNLANNETTGVLPTELDPGERHQWQFAVSSEASLLAVWGERLSHAIQVWDVRSGIVAWTLRGHRSWVKAAAISADGTTLVSAAANRGGATSELILWDVTAGRPVARLDAAERPLPTISVAISPNGRFVAAGGWDGAVMLWDVAEFQPPSPAAK